MRFRLRPSDCRRRGAPWTPTLAVALTLICAALPARADYAEHPRARALAAELEREAQIPAAQTLALLGQARRRPELIAAERGAAERTKTWPEYLAIFLTPERIAAGQRFWAAQADWLARAERRYGVPAEYVVAIIGVETAYGGYTGKHRVLDSLATQGLEHPSRQPFFYSELKAFLQLVRERDMDPLAVSGSYAGAMGLSQFMPSNYRRLAVDFDADGDVDLWSIPDAIGSTANYLTQFRGPGRGWQPGAPVLVAFAGEADAQWPRNPRHPSHRYAELSGRITAIPAIPGRAEVGLIELPGDAAPDQWLGLQNFYNLMAYNPRAPYAMAVYRLARAIADGRER